MPARNGLNKIKVINVVGARPNFMKIAPIHQAMLARGGFAPMLVHTGQHYDREMSQVFFDELGMPQPDAYLNVGSGSHAAQTASIMLAFEQICIEEEPDLVVVVGDVNSTLACSLVATKLMVPVAHVEAGLRSRDRSMPEEINRILTDNISDYLFVHSQDGTDNLLSEGRPPESIFLSGNVMIDSLLAHLERAQAVYQERHSSRYPPQTYGVVTLHRPSNVDKVEQLDPLLSELTALAKELPLILPAHPRTRERLRETGFDVGGNGRFAVVEPLGYLDFLGLMKNARVVITDSGGIQEETSMLDVPCVTARDNTERPVTVTLGSNIVAGSNPQSVRRAVLEQLSHPKRSQPIPGWDGQAGSRIVATLHEHLAGAH